MEKVRYSLRSVEGSPSNGFPCHPSPKSSPASQVSFSNTNFAFCLYRRLILKTPNQNIFFSPVSVSTSLAMLSLGACSATKTQILQSLGFNLIHTSESAIHQGFQHLVHSLNVPSKDLDLKMGNVLFIQKELQVQTNFLDNVKRLYESEVLPADFSNTFTAREKINSYVKKVTRGKIVNLIQGLEPLTAMVLVNHIFFKVLRGNTDLTTQFKKQIQRTTVQVPMMYQMEEFAFGVDLELNCSVLQMEYNADTVALFVLPGQGRMRQLEQALSAKILRKWSHSLQKRWLKVFINLKFILVSQSLQQPPLECGFLTRILRATGSTLSHGHTGQRLLHHPSAPFLPNGCSGPFYFTFITEGISCSLEWSSHSHQTQRTPFLGLTPPQMVIAVHIAAEMPCRRVHFALSLALIYCGLLNSIFCKAQSTPKWDINPMRSRKMSPHLQKIEADNDTLAHKLFEALLRESPKKNIIFSPMSIATSLAKLSLENKSVVFTDLLKDLGLDLKVIRKWAGHQLFQKLRQLDKDIELKHGDILFVDKNRKMNSMFLRKLKDTFGMEVHMVNFQDEERTKKQINYHVAEKTQENIKELATDLDPHTLLFLVNYILFKGIWEKAFQANLTQKEDFFVDEKTIVPVDMMKKTEPMIYKRSEELSATMVKMQCKGNVSVVLVLPDVRQSDSALKEILSKRAKLIKSGDMRLVHIVMPRLKISSRINLRKLLPVLGIENLFTPKADFLGITKDHLPAILEAVHEARVEVSEEGVAVDAAAKHMDEKTVLHKAWTASPIVVKFNRPFFLFVENEKTQKELFVGKVFNPK
ncbi:hypothetical protein MC885_013471 [Smutsia gigantea]|nr:hypothetical protein MC885_013471 [Smutsia gigantea]